jgi:general stress protein CsbA
MKRKPLDILKENRTAGIRAARLYSDVFSPPSVYAIFGFVIALVELPAWEGGLHAAVFGILASLLPFLYIVSQMRRGKVGDLHISDPRQRQIPYLLGVLGAGGAYLILRAWGSSPRLLTFVLSDVLALASLGLLNNFFLISAHMTGITLVVLFAGITFGPAVGMGLSPLIGMTFFIRYYLRRHTVVELIAGMLAGGLIFASLFLFGAFV